MPQQAKSLGSEWEDYTPDDWEDIKPDTKPVTTQKPPEKSFLSKAWETISEPIPAVVDWAKRTGQDWTNSATEPGFMSTMKGFGAGALEGAANLASPLNLATTAMGGGEFAAARSGLPAVARLLNIGGRVANVPQAIHGGAQLLDPNTSIGEKAMGVGEMGMGALGLRGNVGKIGKSIREPGPGMPLTDLKPIGGEVDDLIGGLRLRGEPDLMDPNFNAGVGDAELAGSVPYNNGSGESAASMEAMSRQSAMKNRGEQFVVYDKMGQRKPLIGPDAVDYAVRQGESYGIEGPNGFQLLDDKGGRYPQVRPETVKTEQGIIDSVIIKKPSPEVIKQVMQKGYVFDSIRDDGSFRMIKSNKPVDLPILESEASFKARPTPKNAAKMGGGPPTPPLPPGGDSLPNQVPPEQGRNIVTEAINFPRAVMASMDFSAPLRQGLPLIHKKQFWTSLDDMFQAWGSERAYKQIQSDILERPLFKPRPAPGGVMIKSFAEDAGLKLTDLSSLSSREENLMSSYAEKIPGIRRSNRAYTAFLNKLRADTFESLIKQSKVFGADGETNLPLARELAKFVNTASGRGSLGKLEQSAVALNTMLFSPRLIASRLTMLNPKYYIMADPTVRKEALKSLFAVAGVGTTVGQLGRMAGGTVESDPASSDFGKLKIGNVRLDPFGGFQQYIVAANRLLNPKVTGGQRIKSTTTGKEYDINNPQGPYDPTWGDVAMRFGRSKLNPIMGFATSLAFGQKEMTGQKMDFTTTNPMDNAVGQRFIPILIQDLYSLGQEDPSLLPVLGTLTGLGMSTQVYGGEQQ